MSQNYKFNTLALHAGAKIDETNARAVPLHRTSAYVFKNTKHASDLFALKEPGNIYTRLMNPTHDLLEERMAALEGGAAALAIASGTSTIFYSVINVCGQGDEIVAANNLYGGTFTMFNDILPQFGIRTEFFNPLKPESSEKLINEKTRALFIETMGNPTLDVIDIKKMSEIAKKFNIPLMVDSTFVGGI